MSLNKDHRSKLTTVKKWETEFECKFEYDLVGGYVVKLRCKTCKEWEKDICNIKGYNPVWINPDKSSIKKDAVASHVRGKSHKETEQKEKRLIWVQSHTRNM